MGERARHGAYPARLSRGTKTADVYGVAEISERHRHRYEVSNRFREQFIEHGLRLTGLSPDGNLVEIIAGGVGKTDDELREALPPAGVGEEADSFSTRRVCRRICSAVTPSRRNTSIAVLSTRTNPRRICSVPM